MHARTMNRITRLTVLGTITVLATACGARDRMRRFMRGGDSTDAPISPSDSLAALRTEVEYLRAATAERDTLLQQVRETQDFIDSIDVSLARLAPDSAASVPRVPGESVDSELSVRELMRRRIERVAERLARSEAEARQRADRIRALARENSALSARVAELDSTVARFKEIVQAQQGQIETLLARVDTLERANAALVAERGVLSDSVHRLNAKADSVFVIAAPRAELLRLGVVTEEGGARLPLLGRVSAALVPAAVQHERSFAVLDRRRDRTIPLPDPGRTYRIISAHDPAALDPAQPGNPVVRGLVRVGDPDRFWGQSRYLVLVEER